MSIQIGRNLDIIQNQEVENKFLTLLDCTKEKLQRNYKGKNAGEYFWKKFEKETADSMSAAVSELNFDWQIDYIQGSNRFPDIVTKILEDKSIGIEVKTIRRTSDQWKTLGGSIMESTKIPGLERIQILCAKPNPLEIKVRPFEECVCDVSVTHSPRYVLNLNQEKEESLFKKINCEYATVSQMKNPFDAFRDFLIQEKKERQRNKSNEEPNDLWWCPKEVVPEKDYDEQKFASKWIENQLSFWNELSLNMQEYYRNVLLSKFPEMIFGNYKKAAIYLLKEFYVINPSFRDLFSAGGKVVVNGIRMPHVFEHLQNLFLNLPESWNKKSFKKWESDFWNLTILNPKKFDAKVIGEFGKLFREIESALRE